MNGNTVAVGWRTRLVEYARLMRLDRPVGIWLLLWPTMWGLFAAADGQVPPRLLAIFVLGTVLMRSAGCVINDWADRDFDPHVARTRDRPLAAGRVAPREALCLFAVLILVAFGLVLLTNLPTVLLSVPALLLAASYPFAKRFHSMPQAHLGLAFSWGIPMAWAAVHGQVDWPPALLLMAATLCWAIAYDTLYAIVDREDDLRIGVRSSAILFGRHALTAVGAFFAATLLLLAAFGWLQGLGAAWHAGLGLAALHAVWQLRIAHRDGPAGAFRAFLSNRDFGAIVFAGLLADLWW